MELFERLKNEILRQLSKKVEQLDDKALASGNIASKLYEQHKIRTPVLLTDKTEVAVGKEKVTVYDKPKGFSPGQSVDFALFTVPIEGSYELFVRIFKDYPRGEHFHHSDGKVFFKEISPTGIIGDAQEVERMGLKAKAKFLKIKDMLEAFRKIAENFNNDLFDSNNPEQGIIPEKIKKENEKRSAKKETEEQLKSFL